MVQPPTTERVWFGAQASQSQKNAGAKFAIGFKCSGASLGTARMESGFLREFSPDSSVGFSSIGCFPQLLCICKTYRHLAVGFSAYI